MDQLIIHLSLPACLLALPGILTKTETNLSSVKWNITERCPESQVLREEWHTKDNGMEFAKIIPDYAEENLQHF